MKLKKICRYVLAMMIGSMLSLVSAHAAEMYSEQVLFAEPSVHAEEVGVAKLGEVELLGQRQGFWVIIQTADGLEGWVKVSHVKIEEIEVWMDPIDSLRDTGRMALSHGEEATSDEH